MIQILCRSLILMCLCHENSQFMTQKELDDFLEENLSSGHIHPLKPLVATLVFFVKKKDGKL